MTCYAHGLVLINLDLTWCDSLWLVLSRCVLTEFDVIYCAWFYLDVFEPNLMWPVMIDSVLMCLEQTWCNLLCWCDLIIVRNLKYSRKFHSSKEEFKNSREMKLKKKIKFKKEISKKNFKRKEIKINFKNPKEISKNKRRF